MVGRWNSSTSSSAVWHTSRSTSYGPSNGDRGTVSPSMIGWYSTTSGSAARCTATASAGVKKRPARLCTIALWNRPFAAGITISDATVCAPEDCPATVTVDGSPPYRAMFRWIHLNAETTSSSPRLCGNPSTAPYPSTASR